MIILGISDSHDASAVLIKDNNVICAVSEERFCRRKRQQGFPSRSLLYLKVAHGIHHVDTVHVAGQFGRGMFRVFDALYAAGTPGKKINSLFSRFVAWYENSVAVFPGVRTLDNLAGLYAIKKRLKKLGFSFNTLYTVDHHTSHLISALTGVSSDNILAVSLDAYGDGLAGRIMYYHSGKLQTEKKIRHNNSIAHVYGTMSAYLGFAEGDEGKVMALAVAGKPTDLIEYMRSWFLFSRGEMKITRQYTSRRVKRKLKRYAREDIAFALQCIAEEVTTRLITTTVAFNDMPDLVLAGGLFANVKINQKLKETRLFNSIFVFPFMGDGGTCFAAAQTHGVPMPKSAIRLKDVYLGPAYNNEEIERALNKYSVCYEYYENIEYKIAELLAAGYVVARVNGRMEFGPRALGNRSVLYRTDDRGAQEKLNMLLQRDTFMPFAPVTLFEHASMCYENISGAEEAARYMTTSFVCSRVMREKSPAVVFTDNTARAQLIEERDNPSFYKIVASYYALTGIPSLINTSFNLHGEPIACSPEDAINTFLKTHIDYLALGDYLVWHGK